MKLRAWIALLLLLLGLPRHAAAEICGAAGSACAVPLGAYRVALPTPDSAGPRPVLLYLHGGGGSATEILTRGDIAPEFTRRQTEPRTRSNPNRITPADPFPDTETA